MIPSPESLPGLARKAKGSTKAFFDKLRKGNPRLVDDAFHGAHEAVFERVDCLKCANCCKTTSPIFYDRDIERLAKALHLKPAQFIGQYLRVDEDGDYVLKRSLRRLPPPSHGLPRISPYRPQADAPDPGPHPAQYGRMPGRVYNCRTDEKGSRREVASLIQIILYCHNRRRPARCRRFFLCLKNDSPTCCRFGCFGIIL